MLKKVTVALIKWYRKDLSRLKRRPTCRFYPTCSAYALTAVQEQGTVKGLILAVRRILRCHPFGGQGIDPVPIYHRKVRASTRHTDPYKQGMELLSLCLHEKNKNRNENE